jgi:hypothetical protein
MWNNSAAVVFWVVVLWACNVSVAAARVQIKSESKVESQTHGQSESHGESHGESLQDPFGIRLAYDIASGKKNGHPDFILPLIDDSAKSIQLSNYRGTKVLLLHFASW